MFLPERRTNFRRRAKRVGRNIEKTWGYRSWLVRRPQTCVCRTIENFANRVVELNSRQEVIREFEVITSGGIAEFGRASAGVITSGPNQGQPSLVQFRLDDKILRGARSRVDNLLLRHPLYPDIEL